MKKIEISPKTNVTEVLAKFSRDSYELGIPEEDRLALVIEVQSRVHYLSEKGKEMLSLGTRFRVKQTIMSLVVIDANFQPMRQTLLDKLRSLMSKLKLC